MLVLFSGSNAHGQLGTGNTKDSHEFVQTFSAKDVRSVSGGANHTLLIADGFLYASGLNKSSQLGVSVNELPHSYSFIKIQNDFDCNQPAQVECHWDSSFVITRNGKLYSFGDNAYGQLGRTGSIDNPSLPSHVNVPGYVVRVRCGLRHALALTGSGNVYGWGSNAHFQLSSTVSQRMDPFKLDIQHAIDIDCGQFHSAILTATAVLSRGSNKHGQLPGKTDPLAQVSALSFKQHPMSVSCGWSHTLALLCDGSLQSFGRNDHGQLAGSKFFFSIQDAASGSEHVLLRYQDGSVVSFGWNEHGNCGDRTLVDPKGPTLVADGIKMIACGSGHSILVTYDDSWQSIW